MDTLYLRENENQGHMKKNVFFGGGTPLSKAKYQNIDQGRYLQPGESFWWILL